MQNFLELHSKHACRETKVVQLRFEFSVFSLLLLARLNSCLLIPFPMHFIFGYIFLLAHGLMAYKSYEMLQNCSAGSNNHISIYLFVIGTHNYFSVYVILGQWLLCMWWDEMVFFSSYYIGFNSEIRYA